MRDLCRIYRFRNDFVHRFKSDNYETNKNLLIKLLHISGWHSINDESVSATFFRQVHYITSFRGTVVVSPFCLETEFSEICQNSCNFQCLSSHFTLQVEKLHVVLKEYKIGHNSIPNFWRGGSVALFS